MFYTLFVNKNGLAGGAINRTFWSTVDDRFGE